MKRPSEEQGGGSRSRSDEMMDSDDPSLQPPQKKGFLDRVATLYRPRN